MPIRSLQQAFSGKECPWRVWWMWGIPMALAASALTLFAEFARGDGLHTAGALLDTIKVLVYAAWAVAAWRRKPPAIRVTHCSRRGRQPRSPPGSPAWPAR